MRDVVGTLFAAAMLLAGSGSLVHAEEMVADRPGFGESAAVVGRGRVQLETGFAWTRVDGEASVLDLPQALLRVGVGASLEVRVLASDWLRAEGPDGTESGWSDTAIGLKWHVAAGGHDVSLRGVLFLPNGSTPWSDERTDPEGAVAWSHGWPGDWSIGATVAVRRLGFLETTLLSPSLAVGRALGRHASTFVEYGANLADGARPLHRVDHGYAWLPNPETQLDLSLGLGLSSAAPDFFIALGFSRRF